MTKITDLISLKAFIAGLTAELPGTTFVLIGNGEDAIDDIQSYYNEFYAGPTLFLQLAEIEKTSNGHGSDSMTFFCGITLAEKAVSRLATDRLTSRDTMLRAILQFVGLLERRMEMSQQDTDDADDGYEVSIALNRNRIMSIGRIANVSLEGWYVDLDVTVPANHLLFPD